MARLILVRHGQTRWNREMRYQGLTDVELDATGVRQAEQAAERLAAEPIEAVYSSDLSRARTTAEIIVSRRGGRPEIRYTPLLREEDFGRMEGLTFPEIEAAFPEVARSIVEWQHRGPDVRAPGGESIRELAERVSRFYRGLKLEEEATALIVGHGGSLQALLCLLLEVGLEHWWKFRLTGGAVSILRTYPDGAVVEVLNDTCHLR